MPRDYLHNHPQFSDLIRIVAEEKGIDPALVEKDYWIMHCLHGLQQLGFTFQLKGGTSLSKGHRIINRFSEDIDILIEPPADRDVKTGKNHNSPAQIKPEKTSTTGSRNRSRSTAFQAVERDTAFDDVPNYRGAGIRLNYDSVTEALGGLRAGVLLEVGFDPWRPTNRRTSAPGFTTTPLAGSTLSITARRRFLATAKATRSSKSFRQSRPNSAISRQAGAIRPTLCATTTHLELLQQPEVLQFIDTAPYKQHKQARFRQADNQNIAENEAFILSGAKTRALYANAYDRSSALYYAGRPTFEEIAEIGKWASTLSGRIRMHVSDPPRRSRDDETLFGRGNEAESDRLNPGAPAAIAASFRWHLLRAKIVECVST